MHDIVDILKQIAVPASWLSIPVGLWCAFDSWLLPLIGFFVLPWTTLAYGVMWDVGTHAVTGFEWFVVVAAFLGDIGAVGGTARGRR